MKTVTNFFANNAIRNVAVLVVVVASIGVFPSHVLALGSTSNCCDSYVESIDWSTPVSSSSYVDSVDWSTSASSPSYLSSVDYTSSSNSSSYVDSVDYSSSASSPSYVSSIDYTYDYTSPSYVSSVDYTYPASSPSYVQSIDYTYPASSPSYVSSIDYTYPASSPSYVQSIDYTYTVPTWTNTSYTYTSTGSSSGGGYNYVYQPTCTIYSTSVSNGSATLSWSSNNATSASLSNVGSVSTSGSYAVTNLSGTRTYTLTVSGTGGTNTCSTTVYVQQVQTQPTCSISANPSSVANGGSTTLTWNSSNATSASLTDAGSVNPNGSFTFNGITTTKTYVLTVTGNGGTNTCSTTVNTNTTNQQPTCSIYANTSNVGYGGSVTLNWNSTNATSASLTDAGSVSTNGTYTFNNITGSKTYVLTVTGNGGSNTCSTTITANGTGQQPYCSLSVNPSIVYNSGNSATITYTTQNATSASIDSIGSVSTGSGSSVVYPTYSRSYIMTVYGNNGQTNTCTGYVTVQNNQNNGLWCSISAQPQYVTSGGSAVLTWTSGGASNAWLSDGLGNVNTNGNRTVYPGTTGSKTYTLTISNGSQTQTCQTTVNGTTWHGNGGTFVSLTQIPYTGFDFGFWGNMVYWMVLMAAAGASAYALAFYRGGVWNYAFGGLAGRFNNGHIVADEDEAAEDGAIEVPTDDTDAAIDRIGDSMSLQTENGIPRLVIKRSRNTGTEGLPGQN